MYLMCKSGFFEIDEWDGGAIPKCPPGPGEEIIVRCRDLASLMHLREYACAESVTDRKIHHTPQWDYEYRMYLTRDEAGDMMQTIALDLDYRNFKSWCAENVPAHSHLAHEIWQVAYDDAAAQRVGVEVPDDEDDEADAR